MFDRVSDLVYLVEALDDGFRFVDVNRRNLEISGLGREAIVGHRVEEVLPGPAGQRFTTHIRRALTAGRTVRYEEDVSDPGLPRGRLVLDVRLTPVEIDGRTYVLGSSRDMTTARVAQEERRRSEERFEALIKHSSDMVVVLRADGTARYASPAVTKLLGWASGTLPAADGSAGTVSALELVHPDDLAAVQSAFLANLAEGRESDRVEFRMRSVDGAYRWVEAMATNRLEDPAVGGIVVNARDVTDRREAEEALRTHEHDLRALLEGSPDPIARFDRAHRYLYVNPAVAAVTGAQPEHMVGHTMRELGAPESLIETWDSSLRAAFGTGTSGEFEYPFRAVSGLRWLQARLAPEIGPDGTVDSVLAVSRDVTDRKQAEEALTHQALHDPVTGLPNRVLLLDRVSQALLRLERRGARVTLLFLDLDRFKVVNDSLGHPTGDRLLVEVSERLRAALRPDDTIARFGGDEFVVLCEDLDGDDHAIVVAERIAAALAPPFTSGDQSLSVTASVGIVTTDNPLAEPAALVRDADAAMYRAKERGRARHEFFSTALRQRAVARLDIETRLRRALEHDQLRLVYQPVVSISQQRIVGAEALLRWEHPQRGLIGPAEFLSVAEDTGLIVPIGTWTLHESIACLARWNVSAPSPHPPTMMVNLSARQLTQPDLVKHVSGALEATGVEPQHLCLEITEAAVIHDRATAETALQALRATGVRLALDDFGTGYSSLAHLRRLPIDIVKLHQSLTHSINHDPSDFSIAQALTTMAHSLGHTVVAEGIETATQLQAAHQIGVDQAQGNHCYPPLAPTTLVGLRVTSRVNIDQPLATRP